MSRQELAQASSQFDLFDAQKKGFLTAERAQEALLSLGFDGREIKGFDPQKPAKLSKDDFLKLYKLAIKAPADPIRVAKQTVVVNGSVNVEAAVVRNALVREGVPPGISERDIRELMASLPVRANQTIDAKQLAYFLQS
eukprot:m.16419 g.16419  ORF g.16419 m.16419 type:complete len:139 (+) comp6896_c0_seq1:51-467(+)